MVKSTDAEEYITVAERLGMSSGAVKTAVYRMRKRYRDLLLSEISQTVADAEEARVSCGGSSRPLDERKTGDRKRGRQKEEKDKRRGFPVAERPCDGRQAIYGL